MAAISPEGSSAHTERLLDRIARGDPKAVGELLAHHRRALRDFVNVHLDGALRKRLDASDVVQETHLVIVKRLPEYLKRRPMEFRLWVWCTARERLANARRDHRAQCRDVDREVELPDRSSVLLARKIVCTQRSPREQAQANELAERLANAVANLPFRYREILLFRQVQGLSNDEAATVLGIKPDAAKQRYGRALYRVQQVLKQPMGSERSSRESFANIDSKLADLLADVADDFRAPGQRRDADRG